MYMPLTCVILLYFPQSPVSRPIFGEVFAIDEVPTLARKKFYVISLDPSNHPGSHWVALFFNKDGGCEYFDSYGGKLTNNYVMDFIHGNANCYLLYRDILYEVQLKFHNKGIATILSEIGKYDSLDCFKYGSIRRESFIAAELLQNSISKKVKKRDAYVNNAMENYIKVHVHNSLEEKDLELKVSNSNQLTFQENSFKFCKEGQRSCVKYTFKNYSPRKSLKDETFFVQFNKKHSTKYEYLGKEIESAYLKYVNILQEKLKFRMEIVEIKTILDALNSPHLNEKNVMSYGKIKNSGFWFENVILACEQDILFILRRPKLLDRFTVLFKPFDKIVWIGLLVSFAVVLLMLHIMVMLQKRLMLSSCPEIQRLFWLMLRAVLRQDVNLEQLPRAASKITFFLWILLSFILTAAYSGLILSSLVYPGEEYVPRTYDEMIIALEEGTYSIGTIRNNNIHLVYQLYAADFAEKEMHIPKMSKLSLEENDNLVDTIEAGLRKVENENYVLIVDKKEFELANTNSENYRIVQYEKTGIGICKSLLLKRSSRFQPEIRKVSQRLMEGGFFEKFEREERENLKKYKELYYKEEVAVNQQLTMQDLQIAFWLLLFGYSIACIVFVFEVAYWHIKRSYDME